MVVYLQGRKEGEVEERGEGKSRGILLIPYVVCLPKYLLLGWKILNIGCVVWRNSWEVPPPYFFLLGPLFTSSCHLSGIR